MGYFDALPDLLSDSETGDSSDVFGSPQSTAASSWTSFDRTSPRGKDLVLLVAPSLASQMEVEEPMSTPTTPYAYNATGPLEEEASDVPPSFAAAAKPVRSFFRLSMAAPSPKRPKAPTRPGTAPEWR